MKNWDSINAVSVLFQMSELTRKIMIYVSFNLVRGHLHANYSSVRDIWWQIEYEAKNTNWASKRVIRHRDERRESKSVWSPRAWQIVDGFMVSAFILVSWEKK
jgi:hypothetical protein